MTAVLRMGPPWEEIHTVAVETGAGLIVAGTHGRRGLSHALLGSVAERLDPGYGLVTYRCARLPRDEVASLR